MPVVGAAYAADKLFNGGKATSAVTGAVGNAGNIGKNSYQASDYAHSGEENPNAFNYGGWSGGASEAADRYANQAGGYNQGAESAFGNAGNTFAAAGEDRNAAYGARGEEANALDMMKRRAGGQDLISNKIAGQQANTLQAQQASAAAGARGPAALALAQQNAAANTSAGQAQIAGQAGINAAQEQLANEQAYGGMASNIRGQDIGQMGATTNLGQAYTQAGGTQGQLGLGYSGLEHGVQQDQMQGQMQQQNLQANSQMGANQINAGVSQANAANQWKLPEMVLGGATGIGGVAATAASDPLAKNLLGVLGLGSSAPSAGSNPMTSPSGDYALTKGGGLDAAKTFANMNQHEVDAMSHPGASGGFASDPSSKEQILALYEPEGMQLHMSPEGHAHLASSAPDTTSGASVAGYSPRYAPGSARYEPATQDARAVEGAPRGERARYEPPNFPVVQPRPHAQRRMTPEEMSAEADRMMTRINGQREGMMARGPAVQPAIDRGQPPAWLSQYMGAQASDPKAKTDMSVLARAAHAIGGLVHGESGTAVAHTPRTAASGGARELSVDRGGDKTIIKPGVVTTVAGGGSHPATAPAAVTTAPKDEPSLTEREHATPTSDPRAKVLGGVHDNEIAQTLDAVPAVSYKYKSEYFEPNAERPGERQAGFLTTDLKKTPLGAAVVEERPDGYEGYNTHRMIGLEFAGLRNVHERLRDLEAILAEKHRGGKKKEG